MLARSFIFSGSPTLPGTWQHGNDGVGQTHSLRTRRTREHRTRCDRIGGDTRRATPVNPFSIGPRPVRCMINCGVGGKFASVLLTIRVVPRCNHTSGVLDKVGVIWSNQYFFSGFLIRTSQLIGSPQQGRVLADQHGHGLRSIPSISHLHIGMKVTVLPWTSSTASTSQVITRSSPVRMIS